MNGGTKSRLQIYIPTHGTVFSRKDIPPTLIFVLFVCLILLVLFQIFVVHSTSYGRFGYRSVRSLRALKRSLHVLDKEIRELTLRKTITVEENTEQVLSRLDKLKHADCLCTTSSSLEGENRRPRSGGRSLRNVFSAVPTSAMPFCDPDRPQDSSVPVRQPVTWRVARPPVAGGRSAPRHCRPRHAVAVVIPYRDRRSHLRRLLTRLHALMQTQALCYRIYVVEQNGSTVFNKASIMNAGFLEASRIQYFRCVIFHDVDLLPENKAIPYSCSEFPMHLSSRVNVFGYRLPYRNLVGGVLKMSAEDFLLVNGYSNMYWGWGAEDDDMASRIHAVHLVITRSNPEISKFTALSHIRRKPSSIIKRAKLLSLSARRFRIDGLNSIKYRVLSVTNLPLFTHIRVDLGEPPPSALTL